MTDGSDDLQGTTCCPEALHSHYPGHGVIEAHRGMLEARAGAGKGCGKNTQDQFGDFALKSVSGKTQTCYEMAGANLARNRQNAEV